MNLLPVGMEDDEEGANKRKREDSDYDVDGFIMASVIVCMEKVVGEVRKTCEEVKKREREEEEREKEKYRYTQHFTFCDSDPLSSVLKVLLRNDQGRYNVNDVALALKKKWGLSDWADLRILFSQGEERLICGMLINSGSTVPDAAIALQRISLAQTTMYKPLSFCSQTDRGVER